MRLGLNKQQLNTNTAEATSQTDSTKSIISVKGLCKSHGTESILRDINIDVNPGEMIGLISKSGEGKTTLIDCITGASDFEQGEICINGFDIKYESVLAKRSFGYVSELPSCYDSMVGMDYLEFIASIYQITEGDFVRNCQYLCERIDFPTEKLTAPIHTYSISTKQKLCIIASLLYTPAAWILDNPTAFLDLMTFDTLKKMMRDYASNGKSVLVATSSIELAAKTCDKVIILNQGKIAAIHDLNKEPNKRIQLSKLFADVYRRR